MLPGRQRDKINIYAETLTANSANERVKTYRYSFSAKAEFSFLNGNEIQYRAAMGDATRTYRFKVHFKMTKYNERQLVEFRGEYYNITSIEPDRDRTFTTLTCDKMPTGLFTIIP